MQEQFVVVLSQKRREADGRGVSARKETGFGLIMWLFGGNAYVCTGGRGATANGGLRRERSCTEDRTRGTVRESAHGNGAERQFVQGERGVLSEYHLKEGGQQRGSIQIPEDKIRARARGAKKPRAHTCCKWKGVRGLTKGERPIPLIGEKGRNREGAWSGHHLRARRRAARRRPATAGAAAACGTTA